MAWRRLAKPVRGNCSGPQLQHHAAAQINHRRLASASNGVDNSIDVLALTCVVDLLRLESRGVIRRLREFKRLGLDGIAALDARDQASTHVEVGGVLYRAWNVLAVCMLPIRKQLHVFVVSDGPFCGAETNDRGNGTLDELNLTSAFKKV